MLDISDVLNLPWTQRKSQFLKYFRIECVPILYLFRYSIRAGVVMQFNLLGVIMIYQFGHHQSIREISANVLFLTRESNIVDHLINLGQLLLVHFQQYKSNFLQERFLLQLQSMSVTRCLNGLKSRVAIVLGSQWGDQGKGKLVGMLSDHYDVSARFNGGANAGHTIVKQGQKYAFHLVPSSIVSKQTQNLLGNGVVLNVPGMFKQLSQLDKRNMSYDGRMFVSDRAHLVTDYQIEQDASHQAKQNLGTTKKGIGPTYAAKIQRYGLRAGDLLDWNVFLQKYERMSTFYPKRSDENIKKQLNELKSFRDIMMQKQMIVQSVGWINRKYRENQRILIEGANATLLDIDLGTYPYVTSSSTSIGGVATGLGLSPDKTQTVIGVVKAYTTRVGQGPFPSELNCEIGQGLRARGFEFGTTTGRPRRCGWLDLNLVRYTNMINGYHSLNITKLDILDTLPQIKVGVQYWLNGRQIESLPGNLQQFQKVEVKYETLKGWQKDISKINKAQHLPKEAIDYLRFIQKNVGVPVSWVGTGPGNQAMVQMI